MKKIMIIIFTLCLLLAGYLTSAFAMDDWESQLVVTSGNATTRLHFGQRAGATNGYDNQFDVPAMPGGTLKAVFKIDGRNCWSDVRPINGAASWDIEIDSTIPNAPVSLKWQSERFPAGLKLVLRDTATGDVYDMNGTNMLGFTSAGPRAFVIEAVVAK